MDERVDENVSERAPVGRPEFVVTNLHQCACMVVFGVELLGVRFDDSGFAKLVMNNADGRCAEIWQAWQHRDGVGLEVNPKELWEAYRFVTQQINQARQVQGVPRFERARRVA